ncbi:MAG: glycoside hydrolase family 73 protein [Bacillota bacterium]
MDPQDFIRLVAPSAQLSQEITGIYASIIIAQAALESGWGETVPVDINNGKYSFNLFGIKGTGPAGSVEWKDQDLDQGKLKEGIHRFRAYHNFAESIADHSRVLSLPRYAKVKEASSVEQAVKELHRAGYALDPDYPQKLLQIIKKHRLKVYDLSRRQ